MEFEREIQKRLAEHFSRLENEAIVQSLCKALGVEDCNPYDYLNRMATQFRGGVRYVQLDGKDLMCVHPVKSEQFHEETQYVFRHQYLWTDDKKPTV